MLPFRLRRAGSWSRFSGFAALSLTSCAQFESELQLFGEPGKTPNLSSVTLVAPRRALPTTEATSERPQPERLLAALSPVARPSEPSPPVVDPGAVSRAPNDAEPAPEAARDVLVATARETLIFARPSLKAPKIGYLRAGAVVARDSRVVNADGCRGGFYAIAPEGYVCTGANASIDAEHELARAGVRRADRTAPLPYVYGMSKGVEAPLYSRIPTTDEQHDAEPSLDAHLKRPDSASFDGVPRDPIPWFLEQGHASIGVNGHRFSRASPVLGPAIARSSFAFVSVFESGGRDFGLTADMAVGPLDRFSRVVPSRFHGLPLEDPVTLPVVFVRSKSAALYSGEPTATGTHFERRLEFREAVPITGKRIQAGNISYLETRSGGWIVDQNLVRVDPLLVPPPWASGDRTWLDVSIDRQSLVAYVGAKPVFVTLVSTGADGKGDPETTRSTIQGEFLIHTKHVTVTMDGDEVGDEFDFRDVPYVQYFKDGYAFHAAYWHDAFGSPRSHGCVNLSPLDARWIFAWTEPSVPTAWHGAMSSRGTLVSIHP